VLDEERVELPDVDEGRLVDDDEDVERDVEVVLADTETVLEDEETVGATEYMFRRVGPPQYSDEFASHTIEHPFTPGLLLVWLTEPAFMVFPQ